MIPKVSSGHKAGWVEENGTTFRDYEAAFGSELNDYHLLRLVCSN
jgi:hypothetical protein